MYYIITSWTFDLTPHSRGISERNSFSRSFYCMVREPSQNARACNFPWSHEVVRMIEWFLFFCNQPCITTGSIFRSRGYVSREHKDEEAEQTWWKRLKLENCKATPLWNWDPLRIWKGYLWEGLKLKMKRFAIWKSNRFQVKRHDLWPDLKIL